MIKSRLENLASHISYGYMKVVASSLIVVILCTFSMRSIAEQNSVKIKSNGHTTSEILAEYYLESDKAFQSSVNHLPQKLKNLSNLRKLSHSINDLQKNKETLLAILAAYENSELLFNEIESPETENIIWFLYKSNVPRLANRLRDYAADNASENTIARLNYQYAKYNYKFSYWTELINTIKEIDVSAELNTEEIYYSYFMLGVALQNIRQHRDALKIFDAIPNTSDYYIQATLNKAISYLRQDWWTDAHIELNKLIERKDVQKDPDLLDRLYLTRGFSQIQFEFYRDARESFRSIGIEGPYTNQALLGIGLSAMHQKDFIAALNAFLLLNKKQKIDPTVEESLILTPFVQEKIGQKQLASAKYTEAIAYFQHALAEVEKNINAYDNSTIDSLELIPNQETITTTSLKQSLLNGTRLDLKVALENIKMLMNIAPKELLSTSIFELRQTLDKELIKLSVRKLEEKKSIYNSYLSQGRFALAKLYDQE